MDDRQIKMVRFIKNPHTCEIMYKNKRYKNINLW